MGTPEVDQPEGARLTGLLSAAPVTGCGVLDDGRSWTLRWGGTERTPTMVVALSEPTSGHALGTVALTGAEAAADHDELLAVRWMSTPASSGPRTLVVVATATTVSARGHEGTGRAEGELLHRDPATGAAAFVIPRPPSGAVVVEGHDRDGALVVSASPSSRDAVCEPKPEVPSALGATFAAVTAALVVVAVLVASIEGASPGARLAVALLGVLAACTPAVRVQVARRRGDPPALQRPLHSWVSQVVGGGGLVGAGLWATDPSAGRRRCSAPSWSRSPRRPWTGSPDGAVTVHVGARP